MICMGYPGFKSFKIQEMVLNFNNQQKWWVLFLITYRADWCYRAPKGSVVNFTAYQKFIDLISSSANTLKYYLYGPYLDSATIFNISVKIKCKQNNPRFLTNVTTSSDIVHAYFGMFLKWKREKFHFESFCNWSL